MAQRLFLKKQKNLEISKTYSEKEGEDDENETALYNPFCIWISEDQTME